MFFFLYVPSLFFPYLFSEAIVLTRPVSPDCKVSVVSVHHHSQHVSRQYLPISRLGNDVPGTLIGRLEVAVHPRHHLGVVHDVLLVLRLRNLENIFAPILSKYKTLKLSKLGNLIIKRASQGEFYFDSLPQLLYCVSNPMILL